MPSEYREQVKVFKAFCDENRLRILERLQAGEQCACMLIEDLGIKQSVLSYHMKILVESGVVESRAVGKWTHYQISKAGRDYAVTLLQNITELHAENDNSHTCEDDIA